MNEELKLRDTEYVTRESIITLNFQFKIYCHFLLTQIEIAAFLIKTSPSSPSMSCILTVGFAGGYSPGN